MADDEAMAKELEHEEAEGDGQQRLHHGRAK